MLSTIPWYKRTLRWGQTNLNEMDPVSYSTGWWRDYWRRNCTQGVIVNAGGIVGFYPSQFDLQYRAAYLGNRDLFGEIVAAAREEGLVVLARMDSNRVNDHFYQLHPDWFTINMQGQPGVAGGRHISCVNSPYMRQFIPLILEEIIRFYHPDGFTDNSWTGTGRNWICHCRYCYEKFKLDTNCSLPVEKNWENPIYRQWVRWSYKCRVEIWESYNQTTRSAGGPDCLWSGMINGNPLSSHLSFCDLRAISERAEILMSDQQSRDSSGFEQNSQSGNLLHSLSGWNKIIPESMAMYVRGAQTFRKTSAPPLEAQKWMITGFAGGISPWWHHVGASQEDQRQFQIAEGLMRWHESNQEFLYNRQPVANVGIVWSHDNIDFYGRDQTTYRVTEPWRGFCHALVQARIPFIPIHADHIDRDFPKLSLLILPDLGAMSDHQIKSLVSFVENGGSLVASGRTGFFGEDGLLRNHFSLGGLLGLRNIGELLQKDASPSSDWEVYSQHNYLRLPDDPTLRHPVLAGFDHTNLLPFGGTLQKVIPLQGSEGIARYIPAFPIYPPETSFIREPDTEWAAIITREHPAGGRLVYFAADIDRVYGMRRLMDHGHLLTNAIRWAAHDDFPLRIEGPGYLDCHLYRQTERYVLHLVNLSGCNVSPGYLEENLPVGPLLISIRIPEDWKPSFGLMRVSGEKVQISVNNGLACFTIPQLENHELVIIPAANG